VLSHDEAEFAFKITCEAGSNGDTTILPRLTIRTGLIVEEFNAPTFEDGLARLQERFSIEHERNNT
jgi:hypothetical protein